MEDLLFLTERFLAFVGPAKVEGFIIPVASPEFVKELLVMRNQRGEDVSEALRELERGEAPVNEILEVLPAEEEPLVRYQAPSHDNRFWILFGFISFLLLLLSCVVFIRLFPARPQQPQNFAPPPQFQPKPRR